LQAEYDERSLIVTAQRILDSVVDDQNSPAS